MWLHTMSDYLSQLGVEHDTDNHSASLAFEVSTDSGNIQCFYIFDGDKGVTAYSCLPVPIPKNKRIAAAMHLTCLNNNRLAGCFELDLRTGDLRYHSYIHLDQEQFTTQQLIAWSMSNNLSVMQQFMGDLMEFAQSED